MERSLAQGLETSHGGPAPTGCGTTLMTKPPQHRKLWV
jgi:hypothetical protein